MRCDDNNLGDAIISLQHCPESAADDVQARVTTSALAEHDWPGCLFDYARRVWRCATDSSKANDESERYGIPGLVCQYVKV